MLPGGNLYHQKENMSGVKINNIVKRSVSFSPTVNAWAEQMARARGQQTNFSAFLADLIREARDRQAGAGVNSGPSHTPRTGGTPPLSAALALAAADILLHGQVAPAAQTPPAPPRAAVHPKGHKRPRPKKS